MRLTAKLLTLLAVVFFSACGHVGPPAPAAPPAPPVAALQPSPHKLVGRVLAVDIARGFAMIDLTTAPPAAALAGSAELIARTDDLRETARLRASRYLRGRTLGTTIISGQPAPGDEVVFFAP
ncbi:MAG: hypothetical protein EXS32_04190 [Opitutus sp.]|nr:hypothetical protein [Opitutus sp.]